MYKFSIYKRLIFLSFPIMLQQLITVSLNFVDNILVGTLGIYDIAAVSFANKIFFFYFLTILGIVDGLIIFLSQFFGKKDMVMVRKIFGLMVVTVFSVSIVFSIFAWIYAEKLIGIFSTDPKVIELGAKFLRATIIGYPMLALSLAGTTALRAMNRTSLPLVITSIAVFVNIILVYVLIHGHFGAPALGSFGAGVATSIARFVELSCFIYVFFTLNHGLRCKFKEYFGLSKKFLKEVVKVGVPNFFNEFTWILGTTLLSIAYSKKGTEVVAAMQVAELLMYLGSIVFLGIAIGTNIIIGQTIGAGKASRVFIIAREVLKAAVVLAVIVIGIAILLIQPLLAFYNIPEEVKHMARVLIIITAGCFFFKLLNWTLIVGVIRAGGDTRFSFLLDSVFLFGYAVPIAFLSVLVWDLNIYIILILVNIEEVFKLIGGTYRFLSKKWINNLTTKV